LLVHEQSFETIAPHTIEESYEVDDAIRRKDWDGLTEVLRCSTW